MSVEARPGLGQGEITLLIVIPIQREHLKNQWSEAFSVSLVSFYFYGQQP